MDIPIRGHTFGQCDRNFGVFKSSIKKTEEIQVPEIYLKKILTCRKNPSPFTLVNDTSILYDWTTALTPYFDTTPKSKGNTFGIQKYPIIKYKPCGTITVSKSYEQVYEPFKYMVKNPEELEIENAKTIPLKAAKVKDVKDLFPYITPTSRKCYEDFFTGGDTMMANDNEQVDENASESDPDDIQDDDRLGAE